MLKMIVTRIENTRKTEAVKYEVVVPKQINDFTTYIDECLENDDITEKGRVLSVETLEGEMLEDEVSAIEFFRGKKRIYKF